MSDNDHEDYKRSWAAALKRHDYEAAVRHAMDGYRDALDRRDGNRRVVFLCALHGALQRLMAIMTGAGTPSSSRLQLACSFCGREQSEAQIVAGPGVAICALCIAELNRQLARIVPRT